MIGKGKGKLRLGWNHPSYIILLFYALSLLFTSWKLSFFNVPGFLGCKWLPPFGAYQKIN
jgi:hypothetical protein